MDRNPYGRWPRRPNESVKQAETRLREEGRVHLTQITWTTCSEGLNYCTSLESHSETVCVNVYESRLQSAPCRNELWFSPSCQKNVTAAFVLQHKSWMSSSKTGTQTSQHATGQHRATKGQLKLWEWEGERTFQLHNACRHPTNMSRPLLCQEPL